MPASIGVNLRVTGHCSQGGRRYMEDLFSVAYQQTEDERDLEYAFFGIYDGHGGGEAAAFAKEHLMDIIVKQRGFWSDNDEDVLRAIRNGYMLTHLNMWKELDKWPKTVAGLPSTAGTTASIAFIRRGKIYIGHVGDSAIVLGYQQEGDEGWLAKQLTLDHKPESASEMERIQQSGGKVISKAGVPRVVWNRPKPGHKGPINSSTPVDEIPFLAVARSLGDLWSYNVHTDEFTVSPDPDVGVLNIDTSKFRCLIFGTDGLWNMVSAAEAVRLVQATERHNEAAVVAGDGAPGGQHRDWRNPSKSLVDNALERWSNTRMRADNTSVVTLMLDPPGPPRAAVLRSRTAAAPRATITPNPTPAAATNATPDRHLPQNGLTIVTRYSEEEKTTEKVPLPPCTTLDSRFSLGASPPPPAPDEVITYGDPADSCFIARLLSRTTVTNSLSDVFDEPPPSRDKLPQTTVNNIDDASASFCPSVHSSSEPTPAQEIPEPPVPPEPAEESIQINEVSSSSPTDAPPRPKGRKPKAEKETPQVPNGRALRSHDSDTPQRPQTRSKPKEPAPVVEKVEILRRRVPVPAPTVVLTENVPTAIPEPVRDGTRQSLRRAPETKSISQPKVVVQPDQRKTVLQPKAILHPDPRLKREVIVRVTRSNPASMKLRVPPISNGVKEDRPIVARPGNVARAPGPRRSAPAPAARRERSATPEARADHAKENLARGRRTMRDHHHTSLHISIDTPVGSRRALARRCRAEEMDSEVHSTTGERELRALRSRNEDAPKKEPTKRQARPEDAAPPTKVARVVEKGLNRRSAAFALRNRLRKRLSK